MGDQFRPHPPPWECAPQARFDKATRSLAAGQEFILVDVNGFQGFFHFASFSLEDDTLMAIKIQVDGEFILNHTFDQIEKGAEGDLNIDTGDAAGNLFHSPDGTASYYSVMMDAHQQPIPFDSKLRISVLNGYGSAKKLQADYILYSLYKGAK